MCHRHSDVAVQAVLVTPALRSKEKLDLIPDHIDCHREVISCELYLAVVEQQKRGWYVRNFLRQAILMGLYNVMDEKDSS